MQIKDEFLQPHLSGWAKEAMAHAGVLSIKDTPVIVSRRFMPIECAQTKDEFFGNVLKNGW